MRKLKLSIDLPFKIGDKVWMNTTSFMQSDLSKFNNIKEVTISNVFIEVDMKGCQRILFSIAENPNIKYVHNDDAAFTKEQAFEKMRNQLEDMIPKDMIDYLWRS